MGHEVFHKKASLQRLNIKSSTKAKIFGMSENMPFNLWFKIFCMNRDMLNYYEPSHVYVG